MFSDRPECQFPVVPFQPIAVPAQRGFWNKQKPPCDKGFGNGIFANGTRRRAVAKMRNLSKTMLTLVFVLGFNVFGIHAHSQEKSNQGIQVPGRDPDEFTGCYQVTLLTWNPPDETDETIKVIPTRFQLLNIPKAPGAARLGIRRLETGPERNPVENYWSWRPKGKDELEIEWSSGSGGYRGKLKRSGSGEMVVKLTEYCDYRCAYKNRTGSLHLHKIVCEPN